MFGIPGDYTPPSRFVRLAMFERFVNRQDDKEGNLNLCQQIINTFTIPFGIIVDQDAQGNVTASISLSPVIYYANSSVQKPEWGIRSSFTLIFSE